MELIGGETRKRRVMDTSSGDARRAVAQIVSRFSPWRLDVARYTAHVERSITSAEREVIVARCEEIEAELLEARTELILGLADAPRKVAGHSRVVDVERALDNIEAGVRALRARLMQ